MTGYYTTKELFEINQQISYTFMKDFEIMEQPRDLSKSVLPNMTLIQHKSANIDYKESKLISKSIIIPKKDQANDNFNPKQVDLSPETKPSKMLLEKVI